MKEKRVLLALLILFVCLIPLIIADDNETQSNSTSGTYVDKAYSCLKDKLGDNCGGSGGVEQISLSILAMSHDSGIQSDCKSLLEQKKKTDCWSESGTGNCDLKSTSLATLSLDYINQNVDSYTKWILSKRQLVKELDWFLEIDANNATTCKIKVDGGSESIFKISDSKKISGTSSCLTPAEQNYFLKVSNNCLDKNFTISCDRDFITTLLYKKPSNSIYYISSETHAAASLGSTEERINAYCFGTSTSCDYEGSLWASLALARAGEDISSYVPYITALSDETANKKYLPSSFLYMLTNEDDYYIELKNQQKQSKYWDESGKKFYDTALALLSLQNVNIEEVTNARDYLSEVQDSSGCWNSNNIRDTAFILFSGWPKSPAIGSGSRTDCESYGKYCVSSSKCSLNSVLNNLYCSGLSEVCCDSKPTEQTCTEKQGIICESDQRCTGSEVISSDSAYCCLASCEVFLEENECEEAGYFCKDSCSSNQEEKGIYACDGTQVCCANSTSNGGNWLLIFLLIVLIILVVLAIIFRNQLKIWYFKMKSKFTKDKGPKPISRPPMPPPGFSGNMIPQRPRQIIPREPYRRPPTRTPTRSPVRNIPPKKEDDSAFEETMKKLRDMSK